MKSVMISGLLLKKRTLKQSENIKKVLESISSKEITKTLTKVQGQKKQALNTL